MPKKNLFTELQQSDLLVETVSEGRKTFYQLEVNANPESMETL